MRRRLITALAHAPLVVAISALLTTVAVTTRGFARHDIDSSFI